MNIGRDHRDYKPLDIKNAAIAIDSFDAPARQQAACASPDKAKRSFKDLRGSFTEEQMKKETERCLGCGAVEVNENMYLGSPSPSTRPENPMTLPRTSMTGNISRARKVS